MYRVRVRQIVISAIYLFTWRFTFIVLYLGVSINKNKLPLIRRITPKKKFIIRFETRENKMLLEKEEFHMFMREK